MIVHVATKARYEPVQFYKRVGVRVMTIRAAL